MSYEWVGRDVVLAIHDEQLAQHGGAPGLRDPGLLDSALQRPLDQEAYAGAPGSAGGFAEASDLARLAAAYAHGIVANRPFVDGNKRVAWVVMRTFLLLNGHDIAAPPEARVLAMLRLAASETAEAAFAAWLREHLVAVA